MSFGQTRSLSTCRKISIKQIFSIRSSSLHSSLFIVLFGSSFAKSVQQRDNSTRSNSFTTPSRHRLIFTGLHGSSDTHRVPWSMTLSTVNGVGEDQSVRSSANVLRVLSLRYDEAIFFVKIGDNLRPRWSSPCDRYLLNVR